MCRTSRWMCAQVLVSYTTDEERATGAFHAFAVGGGGAGGPEGSVGAGSCIRVCPSCTGVVVADGERGTGAVHAFAVGGGGAGGPDGSVLAVGLRLLSSAPAWSTQ